MTLVFDFPVITWTLTAVLLLCACFYFLQAARAGQRTDLINNVLHALMNLLMAAMLWNLVPSTMLAQIAVLAGAALWFVVQAVAQPVFKTLCASGQGRLKCAYHSLTMAGAAIMIAMMAQPPGPAPAPLQATTAHAHHGMAGAGHSAASAAAPTGPDMAVLLAVVFGAATIIFLALLLRGRTQAAAPGPTHSRRLSGRAEHGLEAAGAAVMALMFASMTA